MSDALEILKSLDYINNLLNNTKTKKTQLPDEKATTQKVEPPFVTGFSSYDNPLKY